MSATSVETTARYGYLKRLPKSNAGPYSNMANAAAAARAAQGIFARRDREPIIEKMVLRDKNNDEDYGEPTDPPNMAQGAGDIRHLFHSSITRRIVQVVRGPSGARKKRRRTPPLSLPSPRRGRGGGPTLPCSGGGWPKAGRGRSPQVRYNKTPLRWPSERGLLSLSPILEDLELTWQISLIRSADPRN